MDWIEGKFYRKDPDSKSENQCFPVGFTSSNPLILEKMRRNHWVLGIDFSLTEARDLASSMKAIGSSTTPST